MIFFRFFILCIQVISFFSLSANAQGSTTLERYNGKKIESIEVEGLKRIEKDAVLAKTNMQVGSVLSSATSAMDVKTIYQTGFFDEIDLLAENGKAKDGVRLLYRLKERAVIGALEFEGNTQVKTDDLKGVIKVKQWSILDTNKVKADILLIQKYYEEKGFYLTKVTYEVHKEKEDEIKLIYRVVDFDKVQIKKITFLNNKNFTDEQLKAAMMETKEGGFFSFASAAGSFKESSFRTDLQRLTYFYLDRGYVKFKYENPVVTVSDDKRWIYISIYVDEEDEYAVGDIDFSGDLLFTREELNTDIEMPTGEIFSISKRNTDIQKLTERYQDLGYAFVNVIPKMNVKDDTKTVDIDYSFEKGNLVYFNEIRIIGNTKTYDKVIRRELRVHEGELYSGSKMRISRENVERLGYFQPGEVIFNTITPKNRNDLVDLEISIKERSTGTVTVGAGYGSIQRFFFQSQVSEINLFGRGQSISLSMQYSANRLAQSFNFSFTEPYTFDSLWSTGADLFYVVFPIPNRFLTRRQGANGRIGRWFSDTMQAFLTYKHEYLRVTNKEDESIDSSLDQGLLSSTILSFVRDARNNRFETSGGSYQSASLEYAGLGGDKNFAKWVVNSRLYARFWGDFVFRTMSEYGQIIKTTEKGTPPSERFFLGGPNNMKSFQIFSLTPRRATSNGYPEPIGGSVEFLTLFELEHPIIREAGLKWVLFYDLGNAWEKLQFDQFTIRQGYGFGLRWFSPIGPLRFEWGFPVGARAGEESPVFQFFIGPPF